MTKGKYIVIEGAQGVGKTTMVQKVASALQQAGLPVRVMREPDSQNDLTARAIRHLTQDPRYPMNTRTEVLLYNAARSQSLEVIRQTTECGVTCLVDRSYLTTLAIQYYGRGDIQDYGKINEIIDFAVGDMQPDLMLVLDAPVDVLKSRTQHRYSGDRFDNLDEAFLERVRAGYLWEARQRNLPVVYATGDVDEVFNQVWKLVAETLAQRKGANGSAAKPASIAEVIAEKQATKLDSDKTVEAEVKSHSVIEATPVTPEHVTPEAQTATRAFAEPSNIPASLQKDYERALTAIEEIRSKLEKDLRHYVSNNPGDISARHINDALATLNQPPVAVPPFNKNFAAAAKKVLPSGYADATEAVTLTSYTPRNELDIVVDMLYEQSDLPKSAVLEQLITVPYETKTKLFDTYVESGNINALQAVRYEFDLLTSTASYTELQQFGAFSDVVYQAPTPRYGYDIPDVIEQAGLSEMYSACFDISLQLYSILQQVGDNSLASAATLAGHRLRWKATISATQLPRLAAETKSVSKPTRQIIEAILECSSSAHPFTASQLFHVDS